MYFRKKNCPSNSPYSEPENEMEDLFRSKVQVLWQEGCFVDVTLACENKILKAHKLVLSAYSDYFKAMFSSLRFNQYPVIFMNDVSPEILQAILKYMYCGEVNVAQYNLNAFMKMAKTLKVKGLYEDNDDDELVPESSSGKRRLDPMIGKQSQTLSPPLKKKRTHIQYQQEDFEAYEDEDCSEDDELEQEDEMMMPVHHSTNQTLQKKWLQPSSSSRNVDISSRRKRNNSFGNSSHSSQQSKVSGSQLASIKSRQQQQQDIVIKRGRPVNKSEKMKVKENPTFEVANEQEFLDSEDVDDTNIMSDDAADDPNESFSKSSQMSGSKTQLRLSPEPNEEGFRRTSNTYKQHPRSQKTSALEKNALFANPENEERLSKIISYMSQITPLTYNQVKTFAWGIDTVMGDKSFGENGPTKRWWRIFKKKEENIVKVLRSYDFLKSTNISSYMFSFKALSDYLIPIQEIIEAFDLKDKPENFWSCSEYSINLNGNVDDCIHPSRERYFSDAHFPPNGEFASVMLAGSASGQKISPFTVFKNLSPDNDLIKNGSSNAVYEQNSTGFIDSMLLMKWFEECFLPQCPATRSEDNPMILLLNSCFPHVSPEMLDLALSENVILLSLMPHLHHTCQPMDAPFVRGFRKILKEKIKAEGVLGEELKDSLPSLMKEPFEKGVTSDLIKTGFRICGVFPLSINVNQEDYLGLRSQLGFDKLVNTSLKKDSKQTTSEKLKANFKSKIIPPVPNREMTTSDEDEEMMEETNCCYVCEKEFPKDGVKTEQGKWFKCGKRHCKNYSCEECLPINYEDETDYVCIDCRK